jgi:hypothetical protein
MKSSFAPGRRFFLLAAGTAFTGLTGLFGRPSSARAQLSDLSRAHESVGLMRVETVSGESLGTFLLTGHDEVEVIPPSGDPILILVSPGKPGFWRVSLAQPDILPGDPVLSTMLISLDGNAIFGDYDLSIDFVTTSRNL